MFRSWNHSLFTRLTLVVVICFGSFVLYGQPALYDVDRFTEVEITLEDPHWKKKLVTYKENYQKKRIVGTLKVNGITFDSVGVRYKGNSSFFAPFKDGVDKLPLNLKISYKDDDQAYPGGYRTLKLSNIFRDPSFLRESLSYHIARTYVPAPEVNFAKVTVNGEYWGLYNLTQSVDEQFQEDYYGSREGILFKCDPSWQETEAFGCKKGDKANLEYLGADVNCYVDKYELKRSDEGWEELVELIQRLNERPSEIEDMLNVDEALWMHAFNNVLVNLDSYSGRLCHNYYLYRDTNQYWHPLLWDMNLSMGGFRFSGIGGRLDNEQLKNLSIFLHLKERNKRRPFIVNLLGIPLYRKMYVAHVKTIYEDYLAEDQYRALAEKLRDQLREEVAKDEQKLYSLEAFEENFEKSVIVSENQEIIGVDELLQGRKAYFAEHPLMSLPTPVIVSHGVELTANGATANVELDSTEAAENVWIYHRETTHSPWKRSVLQKTGEGTYTANISDPVGEYYLVAEGKVTAQVLPARSGREWFSVEEGL